MSFIPKLAVATGLTVVGLHCVTRYCLSRLSVASIQKKTLRELIKQRLLKQNTSLNNILNQSNTKQLNSWLKQQKNLKNLAVYLAKNTELSLDFWIKAHLNTYPLLCPKKNR